MSHFKGAKTHLLLKFLDKKRAAAAALAHAETTYFVLVLFFLVPKVVSMLASICLAGSANGPVG